MKPIRCPSSRILAISGLLLGILLPLLRPPHATAQATKANVGADQAADTSYLREMPDPDRVLADIHGSDTLDSAARQRAAFEILCDIVESFARTEGSNLRLTPEEMELNRRYHGAANEIISATYQTLDPNDQQRSVANSPRVKWNRLHDQYRESEAFIRELLDRYLSSSNRDRYLQIRRLRIAKMAPYRATQAAQAAQEARRETTPTRYEIDRFINRLAIIGIALLAVAWVRGFVRRTKNKTCECGAQVSSNAPRCPKCGKNLLRSEKTFKCRNCKTILFKDDHWGERVVLAGSSQPTGFVAVEVGGVVSGSFTGGPMSIRQLTQTPCPKCGEQYPFMGQFEKWVRVTFQLGFLVFMGFFSATVAVLSVVMADKQTSFLWGVPFAALMVWGTYKFCRKVVKR